MASELCFDGLVSSEGGVASLKIEAEALSHAKWREQSCRTMNQMWSLWEPSHLLYFLLFAFFHNLSYENLLAGDSAEQST